MRPNIPLPFGEWRPDIALLDNQFVAIAENVFPSPNSYLPFLGLAAVAKTAVGGGNDANTKVLLSFDGADASTTITDTNHGGSAHTWTVAGNAQIDTAQSKFGGGSLLLDGSGDWVTTPDHADFNLGSNDFTIDLWFNCDDVSGNVRNLAGQCDSTGSRGSNSFQIFRTAANVIQATVNSGSSIFQGVTCTGTRQFTSSINTGWHHLALVRFDTSLKLFIDGAQEATGLFSGGGVTINNSTNALRVGALGEVTTNSWKGWVDEFRLSTGIARWTSAFTVPANASFFDPGPFVGLTFARTAVGSYVLYGGTPTRLYQWSGSVWNPVGSGYSVASGDKWSFAQFGTKLYATHIGDPMQVIDVDSGTTFANAPGSPPHATSVAVQGDFLVLSGLVANRRMIQWSAINDPTGWIVGTNLSDIQEMPDGGPVQGVAGGEVGFVVQDRSIRTMQFLPGDTNTIFTFSRVEREKGCMAKYGFIFTRGVLFLVAEDGFYGLGGQNPAIGDHVVNQWFLDHSDPARRAETYAFADPRKPHVMWAFYSSNTSTNYDRLIIYDWSLGRWSYSTQAAQIWSALASTGIDLDTDVPGDPLDPLLDSAAASLDSTAYFGGRPVVAGIDVNGLLGFLDGNPLAATIETGEAHLSQNQRTFVSAAYPLVDAGPVTVAVGERERLQDGVTFGSPQPVESTGSAAVYSSSRLHRFRVQVPAGAQWTQAMGVQVEAQPDGEGY